LKNILIITKLASTKKEGFESRISCLAQEFSKKQNNVTIITSDSNHLGYYEETKAKIDNYIYQGVNFKILKTLRYKNTISLRRILSWFDFELKIFLNLRKLIEIEPNVIIVSSLSLLTVVNGLILKIKFKNSKLIFEVRDIWPLTLIEEGGYSKFHPAVLFLAFIEKLGYKYYDAIVGTMPNLVEHVENVLNKKATNVYCIPFGVYPESYLLNNPLMSSNIKLNEFKSKTENSFTIGYAGSIGLSNGLETFVQVIKELQYLKKINIIFLGEGGYKDKFQEELSDFSNVTFAGRVERDHVKYYLDLCDVLFIAALPSKVWDFGWSLNKMIDYMMSCKPVIAEYDGHRSMINEADSGFFVKSRNVSELKEKIIELYNMSPESLKYIGERGKDWIIKNRSWDIISNNYLNLINKI